VATLNANPFFETNITNWTAVQGTVARSTAQFHQGIASLLLTPNGTGATTEARAELVPVTAGGKYRASAWVRCAVARSVSVNINWHTAADVYIITSTFTAAVAANTWAFLDLAEATAPPTAAKARILITLSTTPPITHTLYVDQAILSHLSITAVHNGNPDSPGIDITVSDIDAARDRLSIVRHDIFGEHPDAAIRGADSITISGITSFAITDYEAPVANPVEYLVTVWNNPSSNLNSATSNVVTPPAFFPGDTWIKSVSQPALSRRVNMVDFSEVSNPGRVLGEYDVLGKRNKVVIMDVPGGREGAFSLLTYEITGNAVNSNPNDLRLLLEQGRTLFLQTMGRSQTGETDMYLELKSVDRTRVGPIGNDLVFLHRISYVEVDRPSTAEESLGLLSWQDILDTYATWQDVLSLNTTWLDLLE